MTKNQLLTRDEFREAVDAAAGHSKPSQGGLMIHDDMSAKEIRLRAVEVAAKEAMDEIVAQDGVEALFRMTLPYLRANRHLLAPDHPAQELIDRWDPVNEVLLDEPWQG